MNEMKTYEKLKDLKPELFKRLTGVKIETFEQMLTCYEAYHKKKKSRGGKPNKLSVSTQILLMLEYYREYRSMAHMAYDYGVSEPTVSRIIREVESVLIKSDIFKLPGKKELTEDNFEIDYFVVDVTECQIERPKKNK